MLCCEMFTAPDRAVSAFSGVEHIKATAVIILAMVQFAMSAALAVPYTLHLTIAFICAIKLTSTPAAYIFSR